VAKNTVVWIGLITLMKRFNPASIEVCDFNGKND